MTPARNVSRILAWRLCSAKRNRFRGACEKTCSFLQFFGSVHFAKPTPTLWNVRIVQGAPWWWNHLHFFTSVHTWECSNDGRPLTLILLQKCRDTNGRRIVKQTGGGFCTVCQREGILLQKYRDRNGRCIAILFKSIGVRGRFDSPDTQLHPLRSREQPQSRGTELCCLHEHQHALQPRLPAQLFLRPLEGFGGHVAGRRGWGLGHSKDTDPFASCPRPKAHSTHHSFFRAGPHPTSVSSLLQHEW